MPFILVGAPIGAIAFGFIPLASILPLFVTCTMTLLLSMAFWRTPVIALMPDITPSKYRSQANGIINFMGGLGALLSFFIGSKLFRMNEAYPFWLGSVLVIISSLLVLLFIKEPKDYEDAVETEKPSLIESLKTIIKGEEKSALRILLAIFFWFVSYNAIEAFFTVYAVNSLKLEKADGVMQLGFLSLIFLIFALPSGYIGSKIGRKKTITAGIVLMGICILLMYIFPKNVLTTQVLMIPGLGALYNVGIILMFAGLAWALININSLPMVVDMTDDTHVGTFTGLYYFASTLAAITGPNIFGWVIQLGGNNYDLLMLASPVFMLFALIMMLGVKLGEARE